MMLMKFAEKCPKCRGNVQTKSIKKSIGLGFVDIPVAQFCLNPACDWYQDFSESAKPEEIKENVIQVKIPSIRHKLPEIKAPSAAGNIHKLSSPKFPEKNILAIGGILAVVAVFLILNSLSQPQSSQVPQSNDTKSMGGKNSTQVNTTQAPSSLSIQALPEVASKGETKYSIKIDVGHGFNPAVVTIDRSDIVVWNDEENQRSRIVLISDDGLFENRLMMYPDKYYYQFNKSGNFNFSLAEYPSFKLYPNATGRVIVR